MTDEHIKKLQRSISLLRAEMGWLQAPAWFALAYLLRNESWWLSTASIWVGLVTVLCAITIDLNEGE
jgi:hypothetical protein